VPPVYSRSAWDPVQKAAKEAGSGSLGEACVVGGADPAAGKLDAGLSGAIQRMYISDYIERWRKYVAGFSVIRYESAADAVRKLEILSDHGSPLLALFALAGNQTNFPQASSEAGFLEKAPVIGSFVKNATKAKQQVTALTGTEAAGPAQIGRAFQPVQWVVTPGGETWISDRNAAYVDALAQLGHSMQAIARGAGAPDPAVHQAAAQAYDKALEAARQISRGFRPAGVAGLDEAAQRLLEQPILLAKRFILTDMDKAAGDKITGELRSFCSHAQPVLRRYPFL